MYGGPIASPLRFTWLIVSSVAKTRTQLNRRLPDGQKLPWPPFGRQWYAGCTTLIIGNSLKAGIRACDPGSTVDFPTDLWSGFVAFDAIKAALQDENGKISGPRTVVAGFGAGFTESLVAVTPFESIKTQLFVVYPMSFKPGRGRSLMPRFSQDRRPEIGEPTHARLLARK